MLLWHQEFVQVSTVVTVWVELNPTSSQKFAACSQQPTSCCVLKHVMNVITSFCHKLLRYVNGILLHLFGASPRWFSWWLSIPSRDKVGQLIFTYLHNFYFLQLELLYRILYLTVFTSFVLLKYGSLLFSLFLFLHLNTSEQGTLSRLIM